MHNFMFGPNRTLKDIYPLTLFTLLPLFDKPEKTASTISGMPVWAMPFVILEVGALKQWFIGDLSDTIKLQPIGSITTCLDSPQIYTGYLFMGYLTRMQRELPEA